MIEAARCCPPIVAIAMFLTTLTALCIYFVFTVRVARLAHMVGEVLIELLRFDRRHWPIVVRVGVNPFFLPAFMRKSLEAVEPGWL